MRINELIKRLEEIKNKEGNIRVCVYDEYTASEGWDYQEEDLYQDATPRIVHIENTNEKVIIL